MNRTLSQGTVHTVPLDMQQMLRATPQILRLWEDITPLARNEWICWVISAKRDETRARRIEVAASKMRSSMRRPCCWAGCPHRAH